MRQLNKAVNAWGSLLCAHVCVCVCCHRLPRWGSQSTQVWFHTLQQIFPKEESKGTKGGWLILKPKTLFSWSQYWYNWRAFTARCENSCRLDKHHRHQKGTMGATQVCMLWWRWSKMELETGSSRIWGKIFFLSLLTLHTHTLPSKTSCFPLKVTGDYINYSLKEKKRSLITFVLS